mgnify:CR=1 FL=1
MVVRKHIVLVVNTSSMNLLHANMFRNGMKRKKGVTKTRSYGCRQTQSSVQSANQLSRRIKGVIVCNAKFANIPSVGCVLALIVDILAAKSKKLRCPKP